VNEFRRCLLSSPCFAGSTYDLAIHLSVFSAAEAFNAEMNRRPQACWLVWVHQDVFLPQGWDLRFIEALAEAEIRVPGTAVVGVYGVTGAGDDARHAGNLLDRRSPLRGEVALPCRVDSIDELLFAVRTDSGLMLDSALGFDLYGTDLALTARAAGYEVVVVDAYCEHCSRTTQELVSESTLARIAKSGEVFEKKWAHRLPVVTPCCIINEIGDVQRKLNEIKSQRMDSAP